MKIGIAAEGNSKDSMVSMHFGRAPYVVLVHLEDDISEYIHLGEDHHDHNLGLRLKDMGVEAFIVGGMGPGAAGVFVNSGIKLYHVSKSISVREAIEQYRKGLLPEFSVGGTPGHHHSHGHHEH